MAQPLVPVLKEVIESPWGVEPEAFSELSLRGAAGNCLNLLAPILRELSQDQDARWLTLIAPPASVTQACCSPVAGFQTGARRCESPVCGLPPIQ